eukprot:Selendium_serpulae@DN6258_c2_g1_i3.p2
MATAEVAKEPDSKTVAARPVSSPASNRSSNSSRSISVSSDSRSANRNRRSRTPPRAARSPSPKQRRKSSPSPDHKRGSGSGGAPRWRDKDISTDNQIRPHERQRYHTPEKEKVRSPERPRERYERSERDRYSRGEQNRGEFWYSNRMKDADRRPPPEFGRDRDGERSYFGHDRRDRETSFRPAWYEARPRDRPHDRDMPIGSSRSGGVGRGSGPDFGRGGLVGAGRGASAAGRGGVMSPQSPQSPYDRFGAGTRGRGRRRDDAPPVDRDKVCPFLLRVFYSMGEHHPMSDFEPHGKVPAHHEFQTYSWSDATLRELVDLVKDVIPEARGRRKRLSFKMICSDESGTGTAKDMGIVHSQFRASTDDTTLRTLNFKIGDLVDVAIIEQPRTFDRLSGASIGSADLGLKGVSDHHQRSIDETTTCDATTGDDEGGAAAGGGGGRPGSRRIVVTRSASPQRASGDAMDAGDEADGETAEVNAEDGDDDDDDLTGGGDEEGQADSSKRAAKRNRTSGGEAGETEGGGGTDGAETGHDNSFEEEDDVVVASMSDDEAG